MSKAYGRSTEKPRNSPDPGEEPEAEPIESELIAYLDGELDTAAARRMEQTLARNPDLRARAEALKRSFSMLDYLPKPEPSSTFATRTVDRLPKIQVQSQAIGKTQVSSHLPNFDQIPNSDQTPSTSTTHSLIPSRGRNRAMFVFIPLVSVVALLGGYFLTGLVYRAEPPTIAQPSQNLEMPRPELSLLRNLYRYAIIDDFEFLTKTLASPDLFGEANPVYWDIQIPKKPSESAKLSESAQELLTKRFFEMTSERQEKIRQIDQKMNEVSSERRLHLEHVLENYASWLYGLSETDRKEILTAPNSQKRQIVIKEVQLRKWLASLPIVRQKELKALPISDREQSIVKFHLEEQQQRALWQIPNIVVESHRTGEAPWPFNDDKLRLEVIDFTRTALHTDDNSSTRIRLTQQELSRVKLFLSMAQSGERYEAAWLGHLLHDYFHIDSGRSHPRYEMLPEPAVGKPITDPADLPTEARAIYDTRPKFKTLNPLIGKWPDFALGFIDEFRLIKPKAKLTVTPQLGPARPDDFKADMKTALHAVQKKVNSAELLHLKQLEGKWPDYPRELVKLARIHDVPLPGIMPPGSPVKWDRTYRNEKAAMTSN